MQALFPNIKEILKKIKEISRTTNNSGKSKLKINMTTKKSSRHQVIVSMEANNISKFMSLLEDHIANINIALKTSNQKSWLTLCAMIIIVSSSS